MQLGYLLNGQLAMKHKSISLRLVVVLVQLDQLFMTMRELKLIIEAVTVQLVT